MMYGDTARYPLYINAYVRTVRYWLKITRICETRLPYKAYLMLLHLDEQGKTNWVTKVCLALFRSGFGYVWQNKGVQAINMFMRCFRQRLTDNRWQDWKSRIDASGRFTFYRQFKTNHVQEAYLSVVINKYVKNALVKFRFGISSIAVHSLRYKLHSYSDTICLLCRASVENEVHFTLCCSAPNDLRGKFLPDKFCMQPSSFRLVLLLSTENKNIIKNFAIFLYLAFKRREIAVN